MELEIKDVARLMDLPEITIMRWIRQGKIPFRIKNGRYVFDKEELISWAKLHNIILKEEDEEIAKREDEEITLSEAIKRGGVYFGLKGNNVYEVLRNAVNMIQLPEGVDKEMVFEKLIQREELCSTGIGEGVAIPHPRHPIKGLKNMIAVFFLEKEIDYHALDNKPVFVLFLILTSSTKVHLRLLSMLSFCLRKKDFISFLRRCKSAQELIKKIEELEKSEK